MLGKNIKNIITTTIIASMLLLGVTFVDGTSTWNLTGVEMAEAAEMTSSDCNENGYKNWDDPDSTVDGKGCWCWDRENVSNPCDDDDDDDEN